LASAAALSELALAEKEWRLIFDLPIFFSSSRLTPNDFFLSFPRFIFVMDTQNVNENKRSSLTGGLLPKKTEKGSNNDERQ
jgi:hypothetical protein